MKVLIIGGAGYIGSATVREFLKSGCEVVVYDNLSRGHRTALPEDAIFVYGDLNDKEKLKEVFFNHKIDSVIHFAAYLEVGESVFKPAKYFYNNVISTIVLLEVMLENNVKNIVFSSSAAVYGNPESIPIYENFKLSPTSPYGETKLLMENLLKEFVDNYKFNAVALRYFNAAGAVKGCGEDHNPETHIIPRFIKSGLKGEDITIFGNGGHMRDYVHIEDLAKAHVLSVFWIKENNLINNGLFEAFNLGTGKMYSNLEIANKILELIAKKTGKNSESKIVYLDSRPGDPKDLLASNEKAKKYLKWSPNKIEIEEIILDALEWHLNFLDGFNERNVFVEESYLDMVHKTLDFLRFCNSVSDKFKINFFELLLKDEFYSMSFMNKKPSSSDESFDFLNKEFRMKNEVCKILLEELKNYL